MEVVYGHTDSIFVKMPVSVDGNSVEKAKEVCETINSEVQKKFPNLLELPSHPVQLEFEKFYKTLFVGTTKNRNAGLISWKDGETLDEPQFMMTGFSAKRVSATQLEKETQLEILKKCVSQDSYEDIVEMASNVHSQVVSKEYPFKKLTKRTRFRDERFTLCCSNCTRKNTMFELSKKVCCNKPTLTTLEGKNPSIKEGVEGVLFYNSMQHLGWPKIEDSYVFVRVKTNLVYIHPVNQKGVSPKYIAAPTVAVLQEFIEACDSMATTQIDYAFYGESVRKKADPIFNAMGWDVSPITKDKRQRTLEEWF